MILKCQWYNCKEEATWMCGEVKEYGDVDVFTLLVCEKHRPPCIRSGCQHVSDELGPWNCRQSIHFGRRINDDEGNNFVVCDKPVTIPDNADGHDGTGISQIAKDYYTEIGKHHRNKLGYK
jgi:hypothetical protein